MDASYEILDPRFADLVDTAIPPERIAQGFTWTEGPVWLGGTPRSNSAMASGGRLVR